MSSAIRKHKIAVVPGDGIGIEVVAAAVDVLKTLVKKLGGFELEFTDFDWGTALYKKTGHYAPETFLEDVKSYDAILFGSVGAPDVPDHISLWSLLLPLRQHLQQYINLRPSIVFPGVTPPLANVKVGDLDWLIVRENTEGEYSGQGGRTHVGTEWETATEVGIFTRKGIERVMRFAFEEARKRPKKFLTVVTKSNSMRNGLVLWDDVAKLVAKDFPDVKWDKMLVDAMTVRMVQKPHTLDTIVATNLHGDILTDLASALSGSIGIAPAANIDPTRTNPSMFEPIHGSAFDITGKGVANPIATIWAAAEMLKWLGEDKAYEVLMDAIKASLAQQETTADLGGKLNTQGVTDAVKRRIEASGL